MVCRNGNIRHCTRLALRPVSIPPSHGWHSALTRQFSLVGILPVGIRARTRPRHPHLLFTLMFDPGAGKPNDKIPYGKPACLRHVLKWLCHTTVVTDIYLFLFGFPCGGVHGYADVHIAICNWPYWPCGRNDSDSNNNIMTAALVHSSCIKHASL